MPGDGLGSARIHYTGHIVPGDGLGSAMNTSLKVLAVHWPHLMPIPLGIATLVYLYRANVRYHANQPADTQLSAV